MKYLLSLLLISIVILSCNSNEKKTDVQSTSDTHIILPEGFTAAVFADSLGKARHIAFNNTGDIFVKLEEIKNGHGILRLRDTNNDGVADDITGFGN